jgi:hypothetical protein
LTIAACCLTLEGVVLGADSTMSMLGPSGFHYLNFNQKLLELGEKSTLGALTWGLGGLAKSSYRTLFALLADDLAKKAPADVLEVATRWSTQFWAAYSTQMSGYIQACQQLDAKAPRDAREEEELKNLKFGLFAGFCIAGYVPPDRTVSAYVMTFDPLAGKPAPPQQLAVGPVAFWGAPNHFARLMNGADPDLKREILSSGKWTGTPKDLDDLCNKHALRTPPLPIRDAVDLVHACISSTIKAMKFSDLPQICGGPIEIAVITSDRRFLWVKHKAWDAAITESATTTATESLRYET